jgi:hypothetical protein
MYIHIIFHLVKGYFRGPGSADALAEALASGLQVAATGLEVVIQALGPAYVEAAGHADFTVARRQIRSNSRLA